MAENNKLPAWQVRYSKVPHHENELTLAVYDNAGRTVCRVAAYSSREEAERNTRLLAAAPEMRNTLQSACVVMRNFDCCIYPKCENCKIGKLLAQLPESKAGNENN